MKQSFKKSNIKANLPYIGVVAMLVYLVYFYFSDKGLSALSSDMTQGIQMMEEGIREHTIFPKNWIYANTFNIPWALLDHMLFYRITKDYIVTLMLDKIFWVILMLVGIYLFCRRILQFEHGWIGVCMLFVLTPFSGEYYKSLFLDGYYYRLFVWFMLLMWGLMSIHEDHLEIRWKYMVPHCVFLIAFMTGDARYLAIYVLPLLLSICLCYIIEHKDDAVSMIKKPLISYLIYVFCFACCYGICRVIEHFIGLNRTLSGGYFDYNIIKIDEIQTQLVDSIMVVVKEFMAGFGYIGDAPQMSISSVITFGALIGMLSIVVVIPVIMLLKFKTYSIMIKRLIIFRWIGYIISLYFALFALNGVNFRHFLTFVLLDIFIAIFFIKDSFMKQKNLQWIVAVIIIIGYLLMNWAKIPQIADSSIVDDRYTVIDELKKRGLTYGYGEYWSASVIQTFSNDELRILPCNVEERMAWYCPKELYLPADSEEPTFYISEREAYNTTVGNETFRKLYDDYTEKLEIGNYVVLIYDYNIVHNFKEYRAKGQFNQLKYMVSSLPDERDCSDAIYLVPDAYIHGPYVALSPGEHQVYIKTDGTCECRMYSGENELFPVTTISSGDNLLDLNVDNDIGNVEIWIHNMENKDVMVQEIILNY